MSLPSIRRNASASTSTPSNGTANSETTTTESPIEGLPKTLSSFGDKVSKKGFLHQLQTSPLAGLVDAMGNKEAMDDRKLFMENMLMYISQLEEGEFSKSLNQSFIRLLYNDLEHPPATMLGPQYAFRTADGSFNNISIPDMGKAGQPYARSVQPIRPLMAAELPDPGLVFDALLKRDGFVEHPAGCSALMFSFAALVIHSVFRTKHGDPTINETSSYCDLSPLYGHNQELQDQVRDKNGRGMLLPDVFAEDRLLLLPPAVCVLLVLFSRNHNYIAKKLFEINERGHLVDPETIKNDHAKLMAQDEWIFQTARLINAQWFATVIFSDYISAILGMVREGSSWILDPFGPMRNEDHSVFERGRGNVCSIEFNSLYRWHATASRGDQMWQDNLFKKIFPDKTHDDITIRDFAQARVKLEGSKPDITDWTFGGIERQEDGTFKDADLARILHNATADPAGAFRARGIPPSMRLHEIMGIEGNRRLGVCSLNEFRKYLGLKPFTNFREWNSDPAVADVAEKLYGDIENLELYVGLQAEEAKPVVDGAGLCPGYTISRCILSDAIALTRGDRFFTSDYTPFNLTAWGFEDSARQPKGAGFGGTLGRLFLRTLPNHYNHNSVYTWFPMLTPVAMKKFLTKLNKLNEYSLERPGLYQAAPRHITDRETASALLKQPEIFTAPYAVKAANVVKGKGFFTAESDGAVAEKQRQQIMTAIIGNSDKDITDFFYDMTLKLIQTNSYPMIGNNTRAIDVVRDVLKLVPLYWAAEELAGINITDLDGTEGDMTPRELFDKLTDIYTYIFLDFETYRELELSTKVKADVDDLLRRIRNGTGVGTKRVSPSSLDDGISNFAQMSVIGKVSRMFKKSVAKKNIVNRLRALTDAAEFPENSLLAVLISSTVELSLALINMVDMYMPQGQPGAPTNPVAPGNVTLETCLHTAKTARITNPAFRGIHRIAQKEQSGFAANERVFIDTFACNAGGEDEHSLISDGLSRCLGDELTHKIMAEVLRAMMSLKNVRRAPGKSGTLGHFEDSDKPTIRKSYMKDGRFLTPWPSSMVLQFEQSA